MKVIRVLALLFIVLSTSGCRSPSAATNTTKALIQPTPLMDGIVSYQTFSQVKTLPKLKNAKWKTLEHSTGFLTVETGNYSHLGFTGTATFAFFKGRLLRTWFVTPQYVKYRNALTKKLHIKWDKTSQAVIGKTQFYYSLKTVTWSDLVLQEEAGVWISNQPGYHDQKM